MRFSRIGWIDYARDAALRVVRVGFGALFFCDDKDLQSRFERKLDGEEKSGAAGAKNKNVGIRNGLGL
jgi:hypothetical protein